LDSMAGVSVPFPFHSKAKCVVVQEGA
jgi:hypothetical protein